MDCLTPTGRTNMRDTLRSLLGLKRAAGQDIELPNESGRRDPYLPPPRPKGPTVEESLRRAREGYRLLQEKLNPSKGKP